MQNKLHGRVLLILVLSMTLYLSKITEFSPIYVIYLALTPAILVYVLPAVWGRMPIDSIILTGLLILITILNAKNLKSGEYINLFLGIISYIYIRALRHIFLPDYWINLTRITAVAAIISLSADSVYRLTHPEMPAGESGLVLAENESLWFYPYKYSSVMFSDSNTTALVAMLVLFLIIGSRSALKRPVFLWDVWALIAIIVFSISRSAIISTFIGILYYFSIKGSRSHRLVSGLFLLILAAIFINSGLTSLFASEGSLLSKFDIFNAAALYIENSDVDVTIFGVGLGESTKVFGLYSHIIYITYLVEGGFLALIIFLVFIFVYVKKNGLIVILPFLIASASYFLYFGAPFLFIPLAIYANVVFLKNRIEKLVPSWLPSGSE